MDIPAPAGTPVYAAADGAASLNNHWVMGISVKLDHGGSLATLYGHLSACAVKDGDLVEKASSSVMWAAQATVPETICILKWT